MEYPSEAKYMKIRNYNDKVLARHTTRISPFNGADFGPRNVDRIMFNIPSETGMEIDLDTLMLHFDAEITLLDAANGGVYNVTFLNSIESIIQTLQIRKGTSFLLEDIQRYNFLDSIFMNYISDDYNKCVGAAMMGIDNYYNRVQSVTAPASGIVSTSAKNYCIPFRLSGISNYSGLISTSLIDSVSAFQFQIELAPSPECIQVNRTDAVATAGSAPANVTYKLTKCFLSYDLVRMAPEYHAQLQSSISRGVPLQIPYKTWRTSLFSIPGTPTTMHTFNINDTVKSLNAVFVAFFRQDEQNKITIAGKDRKHKPPNLISAQLQLGSFYYPLQSMSTKGNACQAFLELQKALGLTFVRSEYTGPFGFHGSRYHTPHRQTSQNLLGGGEGGFAAGSPAALLSENGVAVSAPYTGNGGLAYGANYASIKQQDGATDPTTLAQAVRFAAEAGGSPCTEFVLGFNLRKVLDAVESEIVGVDIQSSGSGLMTLRLEWEGDGPDDVAYTMVVASLYDAVLEIQSNQQTFRVE